MSDALKYKFSNLSNAWNAFTELLEEAENMLKEKQAEFQVMVLDDQEQFLKDCKQFWQYWVEYKAVASQNVELRASGSYKNYLSKF